MARGEREQSVVGVLSPGEVGVGSSQPHTVDIRIIAATNEDLEKAIKPKEFREDLYYRLNVIRMDLPPLRERLSQIYHSRINEVNVFAKNLIGTSESFPEKGKKWRW